MNAVIVDTNVIGIANGAADHASRECIESCQDRLQQIIEQHEKVVVDWRIFKEYETYTKPNTRKRIGDLFVKRLLQNRGNPNICTIVHITPLTGNGTDFEEFPDDLALFGFDPDDRKFIAVSLVHKRDTGQAATIILAIDRGWLQFIDALENYGVSIDFICQDDIQRTREDRQRS